MSDDAKLSVFDFVVTTQVATKLPFMQVVDDDILRKEGVIEEGFDLIGDPTNGVTYKELKYEGKSISCKPDKLVFNFELSKIDHGTIVPSVEKLINIVPAISLNACGINFSVFKKQENAGRDILQRLICAKEFAKEAEKASVQLIYEKKILDTHKSQLHLDVVSGVSSSNGQEESGFIVRFNYHHKIESRKDAKAIISEYKKYYNDANQIASSVLDAVNG